MATRAYLRDRTNQATGTMTSYAIAAALFAAAGIFLIAACFVGTVALYSLDRNPLRAVLGVRRDRRVTGDDCRDLCLA